MLSIQEMVESPELLKKEFDLLQKIQPGFVDLLLEPIEQGRISGGDFITYNSLYPETGCIYGHIGQLDLTKIGKLYAYMTSQFDAPCGTPMTLRVQDVEPGKTHKDNDSLAKIHTALLAYKLYLVA